MNKERKQYIDSLWMDTPSGRFVIAAANGRNDEAKRIREEIFQSYPFFVSNAIDLINEELKKELNPGEIDEYLKALDREDEKLIDYIINHSSLFEGVK